MQVLEGRDARDVGIKDAESKRSGRAGPVKAQGGPLSSKRGDDGSKAAESRKMNKQSDWKVAKGRKSRGPRGQLDGQGLHGGRDEGSDNGDGTKVFAQLKHYLATDASQEYIFHTVTRLNDLAKERRFGAYKNSKKTKEGQELGERELRAEWSDPATEDEKQKYEGVVSYWDQQNSKHVCRLKETMNQWVMKLHLEQEEIEARLRFFTFEEVSSSHKTEDPPSGQVEGSYLRAVETGLRPMKPERERTAEQQRMYDLCVAPANEITKLRERTTEEDQALLMILNHDIEVAYPPNFLVQSMDARELACFTDIFLAIEYPLYAHLAPGQRFGENLSRAAILSHIHTGSEAAPAQKQEIADFKAAVSRLTLDVETRVPSKARTKWVGWRFPMATKMLTLVDYEKQREEAIKTHELVQLDYYSFTVAVRKGEVTSKDMYWILAQALGLHVQSLKHTETSKDGLNDKQWRVRVKGEACPTKLRPIAFIAVDDAELVVHHHEVHVNWPCKNCFSPDHPTKFCRAEEVNAADSRQQHVLRVTGKLPSNKGHGGRTYKAQEQPRTLEQLQLILKGKAYGENNTDDQKGRAQGQASRSRAKSPNKRSQGFLFEKPTLPKE